MLRHMWGWVLYGQKKLWALILLLTILMSMGFGGIILSPYVSQILISTYEINELSAQLLAQVTAINSVAPALKSVRYLSWDELANQFKLPVKQSKDHVYTVGRTEDIVVMLLFVLENAYEIQGFRLEKNEHKTMLVIIL